MHYRTGVCQTRRGLSLVELLVVIAIIGVLMAVLLPAVQSARASANNSACLNNLRQLGLALQHYESTYEKYPRGGQHADLLPYLEQSQRLGRSQQVDTPPPVLLCPAENRLDPIQGSNASIYTLGSNYAFSRGRWVVDTHDETPFSGRYRADQVKDGLTNTLALAEVKLSTPLLAQFTGLTRRPPTDSTTFENAAGTRYFLSSDGVNRSHLVRPGRRASRLHDNLPTWHDRHLLRRRQRVRHQRRWHQRHVRSHHRAKPAWPLGQRRVPRCSRSAHQRCHPRCRVASPLDPLRPRSHGLPAVTPASSATKRRAPTKVRRRRTGGFWRTALGECPLHWRTAEPEQAHAAEHSRSSIS